jgi:SAM-dependent methyltransferase
MPAESPPAPLLICPACEGRLRSWRKVPASDPVLAGRWFHLDRCERCGSAATREPAPAGLHESGAYGGGRPRLHRLAAPVLGAFDRRRLKLLRNIAPPPGRLLDVGAGRGRFVAAAAAAGYDAAGLEPAQRAGDQPAPGVIRAGVEDAEITARSCRIVSLWHVLEHLEDPAVALRRIRGWVQADGVLLVGVPNLGSLQHRLGGITWYHLDVPRHRTQFTIAGMRALLERTGFEVIAVEHRLAEHNPFGMWQSLASRLTRTPSYLYHLLKRNAPLRSRDLVVTAVALPLAPLAVAIELLAARAARGGTVAVLARPAEPGSTGE